jgi:dUTPase
MSNNSIIKFASVRSDENIPPSRANKYDAGIDFYVPKFDEQFLVDLKEKNNGPEFIRNSVLVFNKEKNFIILPPHHRILIPCGFKCLMQTPDRALIASNKGGISTKKGLVYSAQVVDYEYQGEIHIGLINTGTDNIFIYEDEKIIQFIETPIYTSDIEIVNEKDLYSEKTTRGDGAFGSTNKK